MKEVFEKIYTNGSWKDTHGTNSGPGSSIQCSKKYIDFLEEFIAKNSIREIVDLGCGDFNLMKHCNLAGINYSGVEIVSFVVENNNTQYGSDTVKFANHNIIEYVHPNKCDLVLLKDVLQHLSYEAIFKCLNNITYSKYVLITNDVADDNVNIPNGGYRPLDLSKEPFNLSVTPVFDFDSCGFHKRVVLYC